MYTIEATGTAQGLLVRLSTLTFKLDNADCVHVCVCAISALLYKTCTLFPCAMSYICMYITAYPSPPKSITVCLLFFFCLSPPFPHSYSSMHCTFRGVLPPTSQQASLMQLRVCQGGKPCQLAYRASGHHHTSQARVLAAATWLH